MAINFNSPIRRSGTGFANIQKYLGANRPASLGGAISNQVQQEAGNIRHDIGQKQQEFQQAITPEQQRLQQGGGLITSAINDPTKFIQDQKQLDEFTKLRTGQYGYDPEKYKRSAQEIGQETQQLKDIGNLSRTSGGRFELLKRSIGAPNYTRGQQRFDELLLGAAPGQNYKQAIRQTAQQAGRYGQQTQAGMIGGIQNTEALRQQNIQNALSQLGSEEKGTGAIGGITSDISKRMEEANKQRENLYNQARLYLTGQTDVLAPELQNILVEPTPSGVTEKIRQANPLTRRFGGESQAAIDALNASLQQGNIATRGNIATPEQAARYQALQKLAGTTGQFIRPEEVQQAGKLGSPLTFDPTKFQEVRQNAIKSDIGNAIKNWAQTWDAINSQRYAHGGVRMTDESTNNLINQAYQQNVGKFNELMKNYGLTPAQLHGLAMQYRASGYNPETLQTLLPNY